MGDGGYGAHELARSRHGHRGRLTPVSKLHPEANPFEPPGPDPGDGRPAAKGQAPPRPCRAAAAAEPRPATVGWYGGGTRSVGIAGGSGHRYESGHGPVPIGRASVKDRGGTHRDECSFGTGPAMDPVAMVDAHAGRRDLEAAFQEARCRPGLETTRGWCRRTAPRAAPRLFGLYTTVALPYQALPDSKRPGGVRRPGKVGVTFSDAPTSVRRWPWRERVSPQAGGGAALEGLPQSLRDVLFYALAPAA